MWRRDQDRHISLEDDVEFISDASSLHNDFTSFHIFIVESFDQMNVVLRFYITFLEELNLLDHGDDDLLLFEGSLVCLLVKRWYHLFHI
jgi:hypothetical protein